MLKPIPASVQGLLVVADSTPQDCMNTALPSLDDSLARRSMEPKRATIWT